ncbi:MAG TPA: C25 family cysteine peptidase [Candidatus Eisenbacteria bacterium]|nr:C25 family cysteine peptidase [Candidatus Eisenbacteria bacterium]
MPGWLGGRVTPADALPAGPPRAAPDPGHAAPFAPSLLPSTSGSPVACVIVAPDSLADVFQRLADHQTRIGQPTVVRGLSTVRVLDPRSNDLAQAVRSFLRSAYELWGTRSAVLAADHEQIPLRMVRVLVPTVEYIPTDTYYADLDGTWDRNGNGIYGEVADSLDMVPDLVVGRLPATTRAEATAMVDKALRYMKNPPAGALTKGLLLAEVLFPSEWTPGELITTDGAVEAESLRVRIPGCAATERYYENHTVYPGTAPLSKSAALSAISRGHNVVVHVGHGSRSQISVGNEIVTGTELAAVSSGDSAALWVSSNCASAAADYDCVAEKLVRKPNGGALAYVGATRDAWASNSAVLSKALFGSLFGAASPTLGEAVEEARERFLPAARSELLARWTYFETILLGVPTLRIWKCPPGVLTVTRPSSVSIGASSFQVTVNSGGVPVPSAVVTVWKAGEDYRSVLTSASGVATVPFHPASTGGFSLTVETPGTLPFLDSLTVTSSTPARFALVNGAARDDLGGDSDGAVGTGETFGFGGSIKNVGGTASSGGLTVTVQALTSGVAVDVATASAPSLGAGFQTPVPIALRAHALASPNESRADRFRLILADASRADTSEIAITVGAPVALVARSSFSDAGIGNGNGVLDTGETASYAFTIGNDGGARLRSVTIQLQNPSAGVTIVDPSASLGNIAAGGAVTASALRFQVTTPPPGRLFDLRVQDFYGHVWIQPIERTAPPVPSGLHVETSTIDRLSLSWEPIGAADLAGYHVFRGPNDASTPVRITTLPVRRIPSYEDVGLSNLTVYRYQVCGVDSSGNEGPRSSLLVASTSPPGLPGWPVVLGQSTSSNVALADLDGDSRPEVLVGAEYLYVVRHDGSDWVDGDQTPATVGIFSTLLHNIASSPAAADLDLDGAPEIIAASWNDSTVAVFRADGSLHPGWPRKGSAPFWSVPAVGNLDADPELEIVIGSNAQRLYAWNEDGSEVMDGDANPATQGVYFAPAGMGTVISSPAVADLNGDVQREVVFGTSGGRVYAVRAGAVLPGWPFQATGVMSSSPAVGDIIPGGGLEVAMACANDSVYVLTSSGARAPGWPRHLELTPGNGRVNSVALARLRGHLGDASLCVVVAGTDGRVAAFAPSGATLSGWSAVNLGAVTEASPAVADLEGDGTLEVLVGAEDRKLHAFRFDGTPVSGFPIETAAEVRGTPGIWDLDADGATDIVVAGWDRLLRAWRYPGAFQKTGMAWPMFHHDGFRTGVATFPIVTDVGPGAGEEPAPAPPARAALEQNRPNPFNPSTTIGYVVPGSAPVKVTIRIVTVAGRHVRTLVSRNDEPGYHEARWDGTDDHGRPAASGVYLYRAEIGAATLTRKMALLR